MRKRILCIGVLSLLLVGVMSAGAFAATYYTLTDLKADKTTVTAPNYAYQIDLTNADYKITFTATTNSTTGDTQPSGYGGSGKKAIKWSVVSNTVDATDLTFNTASQNADDGTGKTKTNNTLKGTPKKSGNIVVKAAIDGSEETVYKQITIKVTIPEKPQPTFVSSRIKDATTDTYEATAISGSSDITATTVTLNSFPETIELSPSINDLKDKYGITATISDIGTKVGNWNKEAKDLNATLTRTIAFSGGKASPTLAAKGVKVTMTAYNTKANGSTGKKVTKDFKIYIKNKPNPKFVKSRVINKDNKEGTTDVYEATAISGSDDITTNGDKTITVTLSSFPDTIELSPTKDELERKYNITANIGDTGTEIGNWSKKDAKISDTRTITFSGGKASPTLAPKGVKVTMTAYSNNADTKKSANTKVTKTFTIYIKNKPNPKFVKSRVINKDNKEGTTDVYEATAVSGSDDITTNGDKTITVTLNSFPETIELKPSASELLNKYNIKAEIGAALTSSATIATTRTIVFSGGKEAKTLAPNGLKVTMTAYSTNGDGTTNAKVTKDFTFYIKKKPDPVFVSSRIKNGTTDTYEATAQSGVSDITETTVTLKSFPDNIELKPTAKELSEKYNITTKIDGTAYTAETASTKDNATIAATRTIVFTGGKSAKTLAPDGLKVTMTAYSKNGDGTTNTKVTKDFTFKITKRPDPIFDSGNTYTGTATAGDKFDKKTINISNYANKIEISPTVDELKNTYGITAVVTPVTAEAKDDNKTKKGTVTFEVGKDDYKKLATDGLKVTITAYSQNLDDANTLGNPVTQTYTLTINGTAPKSYKSISGGTAASSAYDLSEKVPDTSKNKSNKIIYGGTDLGMSAKAFALENVTTPVKFTATGLPDGVKLVQDEGGDEFKGKAAASFHLEGEVETAGEYKDIKINAANDAGSFDFYCKMDVVYQTEISNQTLDVITWGQPYSKQIAFVGGSTAHKITIEPNATTEKLPDGLTLNKETGVISGTIVDSDPTESVADYRFGTDGSLTKTFTVKAKSDADTAAKTAVITLTLKAVKPYFADNKTTTSAIQNTLDKAGLKALEKSTIELFRVKGPGTIAYNTGSTVVPSGFTVSIDPPAATADTDNDYYSVKLTGTPSVTAKNASGKIVIENGAGNITVPLKFNIGVDDDNVKLTQTPSPIPPQKVDKDKQVASNLGVFEFTPGPVKWTAKNLPAGLKLSIDKSVPNDTKAVLAGKITGTAKADKFGRTIFEITASNPTAGKSKTISQDWRVYPEPKISTKSLPAITIGKAYTGNITGTGAASSDMTWTVTLADTGAAPSSTNALPASTRAVTGSPAAYKPSSTPEGTATLSVGTDSKTGMPTITGSLDRIPPNGAVKVTVTLVTAQGTDASWTTTTSFDVEVKGTAAKVTTTKLNDFVTSTTSSQTISAAGTLPIEMTAYIDAKTAEKYFGVTDGTSIDLSTAETAPAGLTFANSTNKDGTGTLTYTAGTEKYAFKNLPIKIRVGNLNPTKVKVGKTTYPAAKMVYSEKSINVNITGAAPVWVSGDTTASPDITVFETAGEAMSIVYKVSGDKPYKITAAPTKATNGLTAEVDETAGTVTISGTPTEGKETKTAFTLTVNNTSTNAKSQAKITVIGMNPAAISAADQKKIDKDGYAAKREVEIGKSLNLKVSAVGSKRPYRKGDATKAFQKAINTREIAYRNITWQIDEDSLDDMKELVAIGLSFDAEAGMFKGVPTGATSDDEHDYKVFDIIVNPVNDATDTTSPEKLTVQIGVKGKKPKITTKTITVVRNDPDFESDSQRLSTNLSGDNTAYVKWEWDDSAAAEKWGLSEAIEHQTDNSGKLAAGDIESATKGVTLKVKATNLGQVVTSGVKLVIKDPKPVIEADTEELELESLENSAVTDYITFTVADTYVTGDTKLQWKIIGQPKSPYVKATLTPAKDTKSCVAKITVPKKISPDISDTLIVSATNQSTKENGSKDVAIKVTNYANTNALPADESALPADKSEIDYDDLPLGEGTVTYGNARTESALTQAERRTLAEGGYIIAAILPEITTDASGLYELEAVSLDEAAPEGYELVWFAFPRNAEPSDDDTIIEFYDEAGAEISVVPEGKVVVPAPWLNADVTYAPVIAVRAPVAGNAKDSLDEAEAGDTVTEKAIEEAAKATE